EIAAESVEQNRPKLAGRGFAGNSARGERLMQDEHFEPALDSVRNPVIRIEDRQPGLCHDRAIEAVNRGFQGGTPPPDHLLFPRSLRRRTDVMAGPNARSTCL